MIDLPALTYLDASGCPLHTQGPWETGKRPDGSRWLSLGDPVTGPHFQGDLVCSDADANLITAAPDLLEALMSIGRAADIEVQRPGDNDQRFRALVRLRDFAMHCFAIRKAEGRE